MAARVAVWTQGWQWMSVVGRIEVGSWGPNLPSWLGRIVPWYGGWRPLEGWRWSDACLGGQIPCDVSRHGNARHGPEVSVWEQWTTKDESESTCWMKVMPSNGWKVLDSSQYCDLTLKNLRHSHYLYFTVPLKKGDVVFCYSDHLCSCSYWSHSYLYIYPCRSIE